MIENVMKSKPVLRVLSLSEIDGLKLTNTVQYVERGLSPTSFFIGRRMLQDLITTTLDEVVKAGNLDDLGIIAILNRLSLEEVDESGQKIALNFNNQEIAAVFKEVFAKIREVFVVRGIDVSRFEDDRDLPENILDFVAKLSGGSQDPTYKSLHHVVYNLAVYANLAAKQKLEVQKSCIEHFSVADDWGEIKCIGGSSTRLEMMIEWLLDNLINTSHNRVLDIGYGLLIETVSQGNQVHIRPFFNYNLGFISKEEAIKRDRFFVSPTTEVLLDDVWRISSQYSQLFSVALLKCELCNLESAGIFTQETGQGEQKVVTTKNIFEDQTLSELKLTIYTESEKGETDQLQIASQSLAAVAVKLERFGINLGTDFVEDVFDQDGECVGYQWKQEAVLQKVTENLKLIASQNDLTNSSAAILVPEKLSTAKSSDILALLKSQNPDEQYLGVEALYLSAQPFFDDNYMLLAQTLYDQMLPQDPPQTFADFSRRAKEFLDNIEGMSLYHNFRDVRDRIDDEKTRKYLLLSAYMGKNQALIEDLRGGSFNIQAFIDPNSHETLLHFAAFARNSDAVYDLLQSGAIVDRKNINGITALDIAAAKGDAQSIKYLVHFRAQIKSSLNENSALYFAVHNNHLEAAIALLEAGIDINETVIDRRPSHFIIRSRRIFNNHITHLHLAAYKGHTELAIELIRRGAKINATDHKDGQTPLHYAAQKGHSKLVAVILDIQNDIQSKESYSAFFMAIENQCVDVVRVFIKKGINVNNRDGGVVSIWSAAQVGNIEIIQLLIEQGADLNSPNFFSGTPLYIAAFNGHLEAVKMLIENGANIEEGNWQPNSTFAIARQRDFQIKKEIITGLFIPSESSIKKARSLAASVSQNDRLELTNHLDQISQIKKNPLNLFDCFKAEIEKIDAQNISKAIAILRRVQFGFGVIQKEKCPIVNSQLLVNLVAEKVAEIFSPQPSEIQQNQITQIHQNIYFIADKLVSPPSATTSVRIGQSVEDKKHNRGLS